MTSFAGLARLAAGLIAAFATLPPAIAADAPDDDPWTPAQRVRIEAADALRQKILPSSLRLRVLLTDPYEEAAKSSPGTPVDLADLARGSTDPLVLMVLGNRCRLRFDAAARDAGALAKRWVEADTQNQAAWIRLADLQGLASGNPEAIATYRRAAQASRWNDQSVEATRVLFAAIPRDIPLEQRVDVLELVMWGPAARASPIELIQTVTAGCRRAELRDACLRILETMVRDTDNLLTLAMATAYSRIVGVPTDVLQERQRRTDFARGSMDEVPHVTDGPIETVTPEQMHQQIAALENVMTRGDLAMLADVRRRSAVPDAAILAREQARREARDKAPQTRTKAP